MKNHSLTEGSIAKGLLFFVIPLFFSNLFQQLYNTIDTLLVGHFLGDNALAAMGATAAIFELIVQFSNGCGTGFSIVTARYFGSKNEDENNPNTTDYYLIYDSASSNRARVIDKVYLKPKEALYIRGELDTPNGYNFSDDAKLIKTIAYFK